MYKTHESAFALLPSAPCCPRLSRSLGKIRILHILCWQKNALPLFLAIVGIDTDMARVPSMYRSLGRLKRGMTGPVYVQ